MIAMDHLTKCIKINDCFFSNCKVNYSGSVTEHLNTATTEIPCLITKLDSYL